MKKKVWIINHHANDMYFDEGGRHYCIAKYLRRKGYEPVIFCSNAVHGTGKYYFEHMRLWEEHIATKIDVPFVYVKSRGYVDNGKDRILGMIDFYFNVIRSAKQYAKVNGTPDIIIGSSVHPFAVLAAEKLARIYNVSSICEIRDLWPESIFAYMPEKRKKWYANMLYQGERYLYKKANAIVMTWPGGKDYIKEKGWFDVIDPGNIYYISNGVDLETYDRMRKEYGNSNFQNDERKFVAIYTGSIRQVNNLGMIVDAAAILQKMNCNEIQIKIYGDGDELDTLVQRCLDEKIENIKFMGRVPKQTIPAILDTCNCTIMHNSSSILDKYGQSQNKFFEYLASGKPIVMTYSVNYSVCKEEGCGIEIEQQNAQNIARALLEMCKKNKIEYENMCVSSRNVSVKYSYEKLTEKYIDIIEQL